MKPNKKKPVKTTSENSVQHSNIPLWTGGILSLITFVLYSNTLGHQYVMDDFAAITGNKFVQNGFKSIPDILTTSYWFGLEERAGDIYRPLSLLMFAVEWAVSPNNPVLSHFINVLLYAFTAFVVFNLILKITVKNTLSIAFFITLLWIVHPYHTEVVANIKSRDEILAFLFGMISIHQALLFTEHGKRKYFILMTVSLLLSLFSKENSICLFVILPLCLYFFGKENKKRFYSILYCVGICTIAFLLIRSLVLGTIYQEMNIPVNDNSLIGATSLLDRYATTFYILGLYLFKFIIPLTFASDYSFNQIPVIGFSNPLAILSLLIYSGLLLYAIRNLKKKDLVIFGILFFLISIALVSNLFILLGSTMADRFMYMPSLGLCIVLVVLLFRILKINTSTIEISGLKETFASLFPKNILIIMAPVLIIFCIKTYDRNKDWKDNYQLFSKDIHTVPQNVKMKYFYSRAIIEQVKKGKQDAVKIQKNLQLAINQLEYALTIDPDYYLIYNTLAEVYNLQKNYSKAKEYYLKSLDIQPVNSDTYGNLGNVYFRSRQYDSAIYYQTKAVNLKPESALLYNNLAGSFFQKNDLENAITLYQKALKLNPANADVYKNLGTCYNNLKRYEEAIEYYNKSLKLDPNNALTNLYIGQVYKNIGDKSKADQFKNKAIKLDPSLK